MYRLGLGAGGVLMVVAGVLLLMAGGPGTAARVGRVAGIVILLGIVAVAAAVIGHV